MDWRLPLGELVEALVEFLLRNAQGFFDAVDLAIGGVADGIHEALALLPGIALAALIVLIAFWRVGWRFGLFAAASLALIASLDLWRQTVETLGLVLAATVVALVLGIPSGIAAGRRDSVEATLKPLLDFMQTMPAFVYLIPAAMFFGLGRVPGVIATIIFSLPPVVRLTSLGIRQVPTEMVEAGNAFGCTSRQLLFKVQIPAAMPSIMAGVNQTIMLSLSMVVIASMIGAGGLGNEVLRGIQRLDIGLGFESGFAVVLLAILLDRITQSFGAPTCRRSARATATPREGAGEGGQEKRPAATRPSAGGTAPAERPIRESTEQASPREKEKTH